MSYCYETERPWLFTDNGQRETIRVRDHVLGLIGKAGCVKMSNCWPPGLNCADSWKMLALVDRLVEIGDVREIDYGRCAGQDRIFVLAAQHRAAKEH